MHSIVLAAVSALLAAPGAYALPPAASQLLSGAAALGAPPREAALPEVDLPPAPKAPRTFAPAGLPENCAAMPVLYVQDGDLYKNGKKLGDNVSAYKGACTGDAAWRDSYGRLYKNETELGSSVSDFRLALYTGDVVWTDSYGRLYKNRYRLGDSRNFIVSDWTGDVAWRDSYGRLYRNTLELGDARNFQMAARTGDVVWQNNYGSLYKNSDKLGDSRNHFVADRTGDVAWQDNYSNLYLNKTRIASNCQRFELREDGRLLWVDSHGDYHYVSPTERFSGAPGAALTSSANPGNSLAGKWTGWGEWTYQGSGTRCDMMTLTFAEGKDFLERKGGYFDCGVVALASEPARWTKKDGLLLDASGAEAGSYSGGAYTLREAYGENVGIVTKIKVSGLHFDYSEVWTEHAGRELYVITGRLFTGGR